jgi:hypothetical protein
MILAAFAAIWTVLGGDAAPDALAESRAAPQNAQFAQVTIARRTVIRVSPAATVTRSAPKIRDWKERDAPKCYSASIMSQVMVNRIDSIDIMLRGGSFVRGRLKKGCNAIDFYSGFYITPSKDGRICEDRDIIHSRAGDECQIAKFKTLEPPKPKRKGRFWPWSK